MLASCCEKTTQKRKSHHNENSARPINKLLYLGVNVFSAEHQLGTLSRSNWNLEKLGFEERGKPEYQEKNLSEQGREPTTNSTHI